MTPALSVRGRLSALAGRIAVSAPPPTSDVLRGAERLLLAPARAELRASYAALLSAGGGGCDAVATGLNTSVSFLDRAGLFEDMSRENDVSYYVTGRGGKGVTEDGREYAWEVQDSGYTHCIPRSMVSEREKVLFSSLLTSLACRELSAAAAEVGGDCAPLRGASVHLEDDHRPNRTTLAECVGNQMRSAAAATADCFLVEGADTDEKLEAVRDALRDNRRRKVRLSRPGLTGIYVQDEDETEVGFDVPAVVLRGGDIYEII